MDSNASFVGRIGGLIRRIYSRLRVLFLLIPAGLLILCLVAFASLRSYAPAAARVLSTPTPTPLQPATSTPVGFSLPATPLPSVTALPAEYARTPIPTGDTNPWAPYAGPILPVTMPIPKPAAEIPLGSDVLNIALLGVDRLEAGTAYRTDTIMILSLNRTSGLATLLSIPRDLFVYIPAYGLQRINLAFQQGHDLHYPGGGFALFRDTVKYNFGLTIHEYIMMDFQGFKDMVDSLGGINVHVSRDLTDGRLGYGTFTLPAGDAHLDGPTALWYSRSRMTTNDFDRQRRQQEVLQAIARRLLSLNALGNIPGFFQKLARYVESDLTFDDLTPYVELALSLSPESLNRYQLTAPTYCRGFTTPEGMMVLLPDYPAIHDLLKDALRP
jgi:polyisoprenyl-teichoic acid--peptidoglycan teichoic acid transferase